MLCFLKDVIGILTLQISSIVLSSLFIQTLAVNILFVNFLSFDAETWLAWIFMFLFVFFMIIIWMTVFLGACEESSKTISIAAISWTAYIILWIAFVIWSLNSTDSNKNICLELRCPDGIWLLYNSRHDTDTENLTQSLDSHYYRLTQKRKNNIRPQYEKPNKTEIVEEKEKYRPVIKTHHYNITTNGIYHVLIDDELNENVKKKSIKQVRTNIQVIDSYFGNYLVPKIVHQSSVILSITFHFIYGFILIFSWVVLISYRIEIKIHTYFTRTTTHGFSKANNAV